MKYQSISPFFIAVWLVLCALISYSLIQHLRYVSGANTRLQTMQKQTALLEKQNNDIRQKIEEANTPFIREKMIRDQLGMQKPGEVVVQVIEPREMGSSNSAQAAQPPSTPEENEGRIRPIIQVIFERIRTFFTR